MKFKFKPGRLRRPIKPKSQPKTHPFSSRIWFCIELLTAPIRFFYPRRTPSQVMERLITQVKSGRDMSLNYEIKRRAEKKMQWASKRTMQSVTGM